MTRRQEGQDSLTDQIHLEGSSGTQSLWIFQIWERTPRGLKMIAALVALGGLGYGASQA